MKKNFVTEINGHDISWYVDAELVKELDEATKEHLIKMIEEGYTSGELNVSYGRGGNLETSGWWNIINWKNIALELYNVTGSEAVAQKARKLFEDNWN